MSFCQFFGVVCLTVTAIIVFLLSDGGVRRAVHFMLAGRLAGVFLPRLIIVGDSLAAGCPWSRLHRRPFSTLTLAEGGATLKQIAGQAYRAQLFPGAHLLIDGGLNDLLFDHVTLEQFEADCLALFRRIGRHRTVIVTLMPFTSDPDRADMIEAANDVLRRLCSSHALHVIDLNDSISLNRTRLPEMTNDGLHFTPAANSVWLERVNSTVNSID